MSAYINYNISVFDSEAEESIILAEDGDGLGAIAVKAHNNYWGKIDFSMSTNTARALAKAIIEQCDFIEANK